MSKDKTYKIRNTSWENYSLDEYVNWEFKQTILSWYKFIWMENKEDEIQSELDNLINSEEKITTSKIKTIFLWLQSSNNSLHQNNFDDEDWLDFDEDEDEYEDDDYDEEVDLWFDENWKELVVIHTYELMCWYDEEEVIDSIKDIWWWLYSIKLPICNLLKRDKISKKWVDFINAKDYLHEFEAWEIIFPYYEKELKSEIILKKTESPYDFSDEALERWTYFTTWWIEYDEEWYEFVKVLIDWKEIKEFRSLLFEYVV